MKHAVVAVVAVVLAGCSSAPERSEVTAWQGEELERAWAELEVEALDEAEGSSLTPAPEDPTGGLAIALGAIDARRAVSLSAARSQCLSLVKAGELEAAVLWRASRADADRVVLARAADEPREVRDLAALSGLLYAQQAAEAGPDDAEVQGQLAYALGTTTHLQPMSERSGHARKVLATVDRALELDPEQPTALATQATLHLRLATLPWIAKLFASDVPEHDLAVAEAAARKALELVPSLEHRLLLAKVLVARDDDESALAILQAAPAEDQWPRDAELRSELTALREDLE